MRPPSSSRRKVMCANRSLNRRGIASARALLQSASFPCGTFEQAGPFRMPAYRDPVASPSDPARAPPSEESCSFFSMSAFHPFPKLHPASTLLRRRAQRPGPIIERRAGGLPILAWRTPSAPSAGGSSLTFSDCRAAIPVSQSASSKHADRPWRRSGRVVPYPFRERRRHETSRFEHDALTMREFAPGGDNYPDVAEED